MDGRLIHRHLNPIQEVFKPYSEKFLTVLEYEYQTPSSGCGSYEGVMGLQSNTKNVSWILPWLWNARTNSRPRLYAAGLSSFSLGKRGK